MNVSTQKHLSRLHLRVAPFKLSRSNHLPGNFEEKKFFPKLNSTLNFSFSPSRSGLPQPDNHEGLKEGPIETEFDIGVTIEGLQEYHDEACLAVLNNKYSEGVAWHDVACHFRSVIVCEDSDQLMNLVKGQNVLKRMLPWP